MRRLLIALLIVACSTRQGDSSPDCSVNCTGLPHGTNIADPLDCHHYYVCLEDQLPSDTRVQCPRNGYFAPDLETCTDVKPESCEPCGYCHTRCNLTIVDLIVNPLDCSKFYVCLSETTVAPADCGELFFNGEECVADPRVCCDPCLVYCPAGGIEVYDPYDCTMYYLCEDEGVPGKTRHFSCPKDIPVFDRVAHRCLVGNSTCNDERRTLNPCSRSTIPSTTHASLYSN